MNFGNPEATFDANVVNGLTATSVTHQYSGIANQNAAISRTVTATSLTDSTVNASVAVQLRNPVPRIGITGSSTVITQATPASSVPVVLGDTFVDESDGTVESHYNTWAIDGNAAITAVPYPATIPAGTCGAHTLSFDAHYGPYTGTGASIVAKNGPDYSVGIHGASGFSYSVRPFAAAISVSSDAANVTFSNVSRATADANVLPPQTVLSYKWELLDGQGAVAGNPVNGTAPVSGIPVFIVPKASFSGVGYRVRLTITAPTPLPGACAGLETSTATTSPLNGPDPVIAGDCTSGGPPCSFSSSSASGVSPTTDGWTYLWTTTPATATAAVTQREHVHSRVLGSRRVHRQSHRRKHPRLLQDGVEAGHRHDAGPTCAPMTSLNVFIEYTGATSKCTAASSAACNSGEDIVFNVAVVELQPRLCDAYLPLELRRQHDGDVALLHEEVRRQQHV